MPTKPISNLCVTYDLSHRLAAKKLTWKDNIMQLLLTTKRQFLECLEKYLVLTECLDIENISYIYIYYYVLIACISYKNVTCKIT